MMREYDYDVETVEGWQREAVSDDGVWFVRWVTDHLLRFKMSRKVTQYVWASWILIELESFMNDLDKMTVEADNAIIRDGLQDTEATRFNDMLSLLEQMFNFTRESLQKTPGSRFGMDELLNIANESDIVCLGHDFSLHLTYRTMRQTQRLAPGVCFKVIAGHVIARLRERKYSLPVDNAVLIMLQVIPQLDWYTLSDIDLIDWFETLRKYGFAANADTLEVAILQHKDFLDVGGATPLSVVSHSLRTPTAILPLDHRPPLSRGYENPSQKDDDDHDDDDDGKLSEPGSQEWVDVKLSTERSPYPPVDFASKDQQTFEQLFQPGRAQPGQGIGRSRLGGLIYDRSDGGSKKTPRPSLESNYSDFSRQSTPRPMKKVRTNMDASQAPGQSTPRPMKRGRRDMSIVSGALVDDQRDRDDVSNAEDVAPIMEGSDPVTLESPSEKGDAEVNPTKWRDTYAEYMAFPHKTRTYDFLHLKLYDAERKSMLKALSRAEARGEPCWIDELDEEDRNEKYEAIEHDMEVMRTSVRDAAKRK